MIIITEERRIKKMSVVEPPWGWASALRDVR